MEVFRKKRRKVCWLWLRKQGCETGVRGNRGRSAKQGDRFLHEKAWRIQSEDATLDNRRQNAVNDKKTYVINTIIHFYVIFIKSSLELLQHVYDVLESTQCLWHQLSHILSCVYSLCSVVFLSAQLQGFQQVVHLLPWTLLNVQF